MAIDFILKYRLRPLLEAFFYNYQAIISSSLSYSKKIIYAF
jgi:hypothetical protein